MSPFGPYADFDECVIKNGDKASPEGFCAWLHHKITGAWPSGMSADKFPDVFLKAYDAALVAQKPEKEAYAEAIKAAESEGFELTRFGWVKQLQAPKMKNVTGVRIFAAGTWTDSAGIERVWKAEDLDAIVKAFQAGIPVKVPLKCGHTSDDFNRKVAEALDVPVEVITGDRGQGQISIGNMTSLERRGDLLIAAFTNVPEPIANLIEGGQYSTVSVEIEDEIGDFGPVVTGVALLGAEEPAVEKATLERALVFGGSRKGARVYSFKIGDEIPVDTLRAEFDEIRGKVADIIKGKKGAPLFRALFGNITELFERMVSGKHSAGPETDADVSEQIRAYIAQEYQGNIQPLIAWAGRVGFDACVTELTGKPGITDPVRVCGWLKGQAHSKEGGNQMSLPKILQGKKPEEIRAMKLPDVVKLFAEGDTAPTVEELKGLFQEGDLAAIAAALGLGEGATVEDIIAAIQALVEKAASAAPPEGGEMKAELKKATDRIAVLENDNKRQTMLAAWKEKTSTFTAIPGTAQEHAERLADIEAKAGKEAADAQYAALEEANRLATQATKSLGTSRTSGPTDFDNEVAKYQKDNTNATKAEAIKAVSKSRPDLYFARRQ